MVILFILLLRLGLLAVGILTIGALVRCISASEMLELKDVLFVEGLKANLISISQICDNKYLVKFIHKECTMYDCFGNITVKAARSEDTCYFINNPSHVVCNRSSLSMEELQHQRLGYIDYKLLKKISSFKIVRVLHSITYQDDPIYGPCQLGKQSKSPHRKNQYLSIKRPLELFHMDLMGPIWMANIGRRKYIIIVIDDFSRYTQVMFLREKFEALVNFKALCFKLQNEKIDSIRNIIKIRTNHGKEFENFESSPCVIIQVF